ncbi:hypothetical protein A3I34_02335 [Candidatus Jorgensenbacteria bacterium RIFCSPLOWO2_02_FULL_45_12]|nr:MAG: hypothetical protein A3D55_01835 [Candidatus Jorgensenbacteria bacterium RIFCSPHIGHO2_02_FULL_45_20]OGG42195.1 MAG: hypothetical protein A3I34_02335 [Candidatus Jorgensenbacteria bacterium RIFCSPLOWO2_02_FULL_45_12]
MKKLFSPKKRFSGNRGFTVVEMLVALTVFSILLVVAVGIFLSALKNQRFITERISAGSNAGIALEQISRELRTGYFDPSLGAPLPNRATCLNSITFVSGQEAGISGKEAIVTYSLSNGRIFRSVSGGSGEALTAGNVLVENACFEIYQTNDVGNVECYPPRFFIRLAVASKDLKIENPAQSAPIMMQTVVSSRVLPREIKNDPFKCRGI